MTDIDGEVAAFAASLSGLLAIDDEAHEADVRRLFDILHTSQSMTEITQRLVTFLREMKPATYGKSVVLAASQRFAVFIAARERGEHRERENEGDELHAAILPRWWSWAAVESKERLRQ